MYASIALVNNTIHRFFAANSWEWKRFVILQQMTEVARDLAFVGRSLIIIGCGYSALNYITEITDIFAEAHTFESPLLRARRVARVFFSAIFTDFRSLLESIFSMEAVWYTIATAFLAIFIPAAGIGRLLGIWDIDACACWAVIVWFGFIAAPFIFTFKVVRPSFSFVLRRLNFLSEENFAS
jgi:hypothetical protein